jgi:DNA-binding response OmpR family regulator
MSVKTVLVVDDEALVGLSIAMALQSSGFKVLRASSAEEALRLSDGSPGLVDLLITDLAMPERNGAELADLLESRNPQIKTMFISGLDREVVQTMIQSRPHTPVLTKPFEFERLTLMVRDALRGT